MRTVKRSGFIRLVAGLLLLLMSWIMETRTAWSYPSIDGLVNEVEQLRQAGEIFDIATAANLIVSLGTIGATIDAGDTITAKDLLSAFAQEVTALGGVLMTTFAADQVVSAVTSIAGSL